MQLNNTQQKYETTMNIPVKLDFAMHSLSAEQSGT